MPGTPAPAPDPGGITLETDKDSLESGAPDAAADTPAAEAADGPAAVVPSDGAPSKPEAEPSAEAAVVPEAAGPELGPEIEVEGAPVVEWGVLALTPEQNGDALPEPGEATAATMSAEASGLDLQDQETLHDGREDGAATPLPSAQESPGPDSAHPDCVAADSTAEQPDGLEIEPAGPDATAVGSQSEGPSQAAEVSEFLYRTDPADRVSAPVSGPELEPGRAESFPGAEMPAAPQLERVHAQEREDTTPFQLPEPGPASAPPEPPSVAPGPAPSEPWTEVARRTARRGLRYAAYGLAGYLALTVLLVVVYRFINPPMSTLMVFESIAGAGAEQDWVPIEKISPHLIRAVVVAEDGRFCDHNGIDLAAMRYAILRARDGIPAGASTISMQVTKNLFLWPSRSFIRKLIEIPLTLLMELIWPKSRILEVYLNIAEWAPGVFGAEAAAQHHFRKPASALGEREAARLAAALPNPIVRNAGQPGPRLVRRAGMIQNRVRLSGDVTFCVRQGR